MVEIREALPDEYDAIGELTVLAYRQLPDMPDETIMPEYYAMLRNSRSRLADPSVKLIVALMPGNILAGTVTYYNDMKYYGSGGSAPMERDACGIRLLAVDPKMRRQGIGRALTEYCLQLSRMARQRQVILHTTPAMQQAWELYERMGFQRSTDLDFMQGPLPVFGFRRLIKPDITTQVTQVTVST